MCPWPRPLFGNIILSGVMSWLSLGARLPNLKFVSLAILELLSFNFQKFTGSRDPDHAHFLVTFSGVMLGLSLGARLPNLKFVPLDGLELLAFFSQKFMGLRDHAHFSETFVRVMSGLSLGARLHNLKFVSYAILELLAFNPQKFTGSHDWPRPLLPSFHIQTLAAAKTRCLNYEPL